MEVLDRGKFAHETLSGPECLALLAGADLARILISVRCLPAALPTFIHVAKRAVLIASTETAVIEAARRRDVLGVQLDGSDADGSTWSVQVTGSAHFGTNEEFPNGDAASRFGRALEDGATLVVVPLTIVTGERVHWNAAH